MNDTYEIRTLDNAPDGAKEALTGLHNAFGVVPNIAGVMANSLPLLNSFFASFGHFRGTGTFTPAERQVLLLSNAVANTSEWAVAFHSVEALADGVTPEAVDSIRRREVPTDPKFAALSALSHALIAKRGHLDDTDVKAFTSAGFDNDQLLEAITSVAISTMTNYAGNVAQPPVEAPFQGQLWHEGY
jgi:alkylhydroperoxidase family enzyme